MRQACPACCARCTEIHGDDRCATCGRPRANHNVRHPFKASGTTGVHTVSPERVEELRAAIDALVAAADNDMLAAVTGSGGPYLEVDARAAVDRLLAQLAGESSHES